MGHREEITMSQHARFLARSLALAAVASAALGLLSSTTFAARSHASEAAKIVGSVQRCGGPHPAACRPVANVQVIATTNGEAAAEGTDPRGRFEFVVHRGRWTVVVSAFGRKETRHVVVRAHKTVRLHFRFQERSP
jgi:hypothetical protein